MVFRAHVLIVNAALDVKRHAVDSLIVRQNLVSGIQELGLGIWKRSRFALNLYGCGGYCIMLYAMTLLGWTTYSSPVLRVI